MICPVRIIVMLLLFVFSGYLMHSATAETIYLKSGHIVKAKIIESHDDYVLVDLQGIQLTYYRDTIDHIETENQSSASRVFKPQVDSTPVQATPAVRQEVSSVPAPAVIPQRQEDIRVSDYVQVEYGPGENLSNLVIDPTETLQGMGLKIDQHGSLVADLTAPDEHGPVLPKINGSLLKNIFILVFGLGCAMGLSNYLRSLKR